MKNLKRALSISIAGLVLAATWPTVAFSALEAASPAGAVSHAAVAAPALPSLGASLPTGTSLPTAPSISGVSEISTPAPLQAPAASALQAVLPAAPAAIVSGAKNAPSIVTGLAAQQGSVRGQNASGRAVSPEQSKLSGDKTFDGAFGAITGRLVERPDWVRLAVHKFFTHPKVQEHLPAPVANLAPIQNQQQPPAPRIVLKTTDEFGGPNALKMSFLGRVKFGLKWGVNLLGISVLMRFVLGTIINAVAWQLHLPPTTLHSMGRVELLTHFGPSQIQQMLTASPLGFFGQALPMSAGIEEITFRLGYFVLPFLALAAIKPVSAWLSKVAGNLADPLGWRVGAQKALAWASKLSVAAFPLAALYSAHKFAVAHFALWGAHPFNYVMFGALGYVLAYVLYRSRSLVSPFVAHLTYNTLLIATSFLLPAPLQLLVASLSIVALFWNWRVHRKALAAAYAQAKAEAGVKTKKSGHGPTILLTAALLASALLGAHADHRPNAALFHAAAAQVQQQAAPQQTAPQAQTPQQGQQQAQPGDQDDEGQQVQLPQELKDLLSQAGAQPAKPDMTKEELVAKVMPSVVEIFVHESQGTAIGSGYIVTEDGLLFTNAHVAAPAGVGGIVEVHLSNGQKGPAKVVAVNTDKDIALIQLPPLPGGKKWPTVALADSGKVKLGQDVVAIGNPLGFSFSVSHGIISGLGGGRASLYVQWLQTDAPINHGNSGGPLFNMQGEVVGMNSWIASPQDAGSIGLGFSIVSNDIKSALDQYQATGNINSAWLGIIVDAEKATMPDRGVALEQIRPGSPAAKAGLRPGDVLVGINGEAFPDGGDESLNALASVLAVSKPGDALQFSINRDGSEITVSVTTGDKQPPMASSNRNAKAPAKPAQPDSKTGQQAPQKKP